MTPNGVQMSPSAQSRQAFMVVRCPHLTKPQGFSFFSCYIDKEYKS